MKVSVSISDDLVAYLDAQVDNRSQLIEGLLQQWRKDKQNQEMAKACLLSDELTAEEWQAWETAEITDWEQSGS
jgi:metal-responsive CopG/Arc/MetJ family transcriptional regulator